jgi:ferredoxin
VSDKRFLSREDLAALVSGWIAAGARVVAPVPCGEGGACDYRALTRFDETALSGALPRRSLKEFFLPPTESLFRYRQKGSDVLLEEAPSDPSRTVIVGAFPCDAAALPVLDKVMGWDYRDEPWFRRREATTILGVACAGQDGACFCPAVGGGPDAARGSDIFLTPVEGGCEAAVLTPKGEALVRENASRFSAARGGEAADKYRREARGRVAKNLTVDAGRIGRWLAANFESDFWRGIALRCHGCGACAAVCPTCHCFDIVDEPDGLLEGARRRNWDTCQSSRFTVHASGHNPRAEQNARFRQRLEHKFSIYPERFGEILCTGCGRCARACPAGMDLPELLGKLESLAGGPARGGKA